MRPSLVYRKYWQYLHHFGSARKVRNLLLNRLEHSLGRSTLRSMPYKVTIDPGAICNLECPGCHTGVKHPEMTAKKMLRLDDFKTIFDPLSPYLFHVSLYNWGEPFLNKRIFDMVSYASEKGVGTTLHSNLNHFNQEMAENCVKSGLTHIYLSIDGATQNVYEIYRRNGDLERVLQNVKLLTETKKRMKSRWPFITWKFLGFEHNRHELAHAKTLAATAGVDSFETFTASESLMDIRDEGKIWLKHPQKLRSIAAKCASLWSSVYVASDGNVFPCSLAFREEEVFGNALTTDFNSLWNGAKYQRARMFFANHGVAPNPPSPCNQCKYFFGCQLAAGKIPLAQN